MGPGRAQRFGGVHVGGGRRESVEGCGCLRRRLGAAEVWGRYMRRRVEALSNGMEEGSEAEIWD